MEWFINVVLLILWATYKNDTATVTFCTFRYAGHTSSFYWMIIFHTYWDGILSSYNKEAIVIHWKYEYCFTKKHFLSTVLLVLHTCINFWTICTSLRLVMLLGGCRVPGNNAVHIENLKPISRQIMEIYVLFYKYENYLIVFDLVNFEYIREWKYS